LNTRNKQLENKKKMTSLQRCGGKRIMTFWGRIGTVSSNIYTNNTYLLQVVTSQQHQLGYYQSKSNSTVSNVETKTATTTTTTRTGSKTTKHLTSSHEKYSGYTATAIGNIALRQYEWIPYGPYGIRIVDYSKCRTDSNIPMTRWPLPIPPSHKPGTFDKRYLVAFLTVLMFGSCFYVYNYSERLPEGYWEAIERGDMPIDNVLNLDEDDDDDDDDDDLDEDFDEWAEKK
jgi:hypothetical protein